MLVWDLELGSLREYRTAVAERRIKSGRAQRLDGSKLRYAANHPQVLAGNVPSPEFEEEETKKATPSSRRGRYKTKVVEASSPGDGLIAEDDSNADA